MSRWRQSVNGLGLLERLKHSSLKAATMAMKTCLLWVCTVRVGDLARWHWTSGIGERPSLATVFRDLAFSLDLPGLDVAVLKRFLYSLKRHWDRGSVTVVQRVEQVDPSDPATAARVKVPAH